MRFSLNSVWQKKMYYYVCRICCEKILYKNCSISQNFLINFDSVAQITADDIQVEKNGSFYDSVISIHRSSYCISWGRKFYKTLIQFPSLRMIFSFFFQTCNLQLFSDFYAFKSAVDVFSWFIKLNQLVNLKCIYAMWWYILQI